MSIPRGEVFNLINGERMYQDMRWPVIPGATAQGGGRYHSLTEWLVYIEDYVNEAKHIVSREDDASANLKAAEIMRKIAGMAVAALEQHPCPPRTLPPAPQGLRR